jgi:Helix-turn-helix.
MEDIVADFRISIGKQIKNLREVRKLTLKELGELIDIGEASMSKIENGKWISIPKMVELSKVLNFEIKIVPNEREEVHG